VDLITICWMRTPEEYGAARVLWAGDAEAREEHYRASGPYTGPLAVRQLSQNIESIPIRESRLYDIGSKQESTRWLRKMKRGKGYPASRNSQRGKRQPTQRLGVERTGDSAAGREA
jgi:alkylation response protein AidB-like acyl-CoA dehydrogenase